MSQVGNSPAFAESVAEDVRPLTQRLHGGICVKVTEGIRYPDRLYVKDGTGIRSAKTLRTRRGTEKKPSTKLTADIPKCNMRSLVFGARGRIGDSGCFLSVPVPPESTRKI